ncbi:MAG TPA: ABC transporter substrate-binding protein [Chloroflexota bacterium]
MNVGITGQFASEADLYLKAVKLAEKQINQAGGVNGKQVKVIVQDNQSTNPGALAALNKNVEQDKVLALIGPVKSTQILAMSDAVKSIGIPMMVGGTNASITQAGNPWLFRCRVSDSIAEAVMVKYIKDDMKLTKIGTLFSSEAFGTGAADLVDQYAKEQGLTVVSRQAFSPGDRDFMAQLLAIKTAGAEVLVPLSAGHEEHAAINREYRQMGSPFKYISTPAIAMKDVLNLSGDAAEGLTGVIEAMPGQSDTNSKYIASYQQEYNQNADMLGAWTYDALNVLVNAIKKGGEDRGKIKDAILATQGYEGVEGTFSFDKYGDGLHQMYVAVIEKGQPKMVKVVKVN